MAKSQRGSIEIEKKFIFWYQTLISSKRKKSSRAFFWFFSFYANRIWSSEFHSTFPRRSRGNAGSINIMLKHNRRFFWIEARRKNTENSKSATYWLWSLRFYCVVWQLNAFSNVHVTSEFVRICYWNSRISWIWFVSFLLLTERRNNFTWCLQLSERRRSRSRCFHDVPWREFHHSTAEVW